MTYRYIYKITCTAGSFKGKFYYGQHTTENLDDGYKGSGVMIQQYYKKHPTDYIKEIISFHNSKEELNQVEYEIIKNWLGNQMCLNLRDGGNQGIVSEETKQKISESLKGRHVIFSKEHRLKISEANKKRQYSEETKQKISESLKGRHVIFSKERNQKISESHKGKTLSEETKQKISESHKGKTPWNKGKTGVYSEETKQKISEANKLARAGRMWVTLNNKHKQIKKEELQKYLDAGWHKGKK